MFSTTSFQTSNTLVSFLCSNASILGGLFSILLEYFPPIFFLSILFSFSFLFPPSNTLIVSSIFFHNNTFLTILSIKFHFCILFVFLFSNTSAPL